MAALLHTGSQCREWWCVCVYHRRRQTRAAGTTNRLVGKDPRSQPSVPSRQSRKDRVACIQEHRLGLPHLCHPSLPPICPPHCRTKDCFPCCPCTATIGEEAGNAPSGVSLLHGPPSCTSFEKSSLLSSTVPHPDTRHGLFERRPRQLEPELFTCRHRSEGESCTSQQASSNETSRLSVVDMAASQGSCMRTRMASSWIYGSSSRSRHPFCDPEMIPPLTRSVPTDLTMPHCEPQ